MLEIWERAGKKSHRPAAIKQVHNLPPGIYLHFENQESSRVGDHLSAFAKWKAFPCLEKTKHGSRIATHGGQDGTVAANMHVIIGYSAANLELFGVFPMLSQLQHGYTYNIPLRAA